MEKWGVGRGEYERMLSAGDDLVQRLNRDCRWLEAQIKRLRNATACDGDKLRKIAGEILEQAAKRRKRTLSK